MKGKVAISLGAALLSYSLFCHMQKHTELSTINMELANLHQTYLLLDEENKRLDFMVRSIHDPSHLIEVSKDPRFAHLNWANKSEMVVKDNNSYSDYSSGFAAVVR